MPIDGNDHARSIERDLLSVDDESKKRFSYLTITDVWEKIDVGYWLPLNRIRSLNEGETRLSSFGMPE